MLIKYQLKQLFCYEKWKSFFNTIKIKSFIYLFKILRNKICELYKNGELKDVLNFIDNIKFDNID